MRRSFGAINPYAAQICNQVILAQYELGPLRKLMRASAIEHFAQEIVLFIRMTGNVGEAEV
jgi:hypothetical protein